MSEVDGVRSEEGQDVDERDDYRDALVREPEILVPTETSEHNVSH